jgi:phosphopantothenoylcysteine decarboxylase / phosphopantothenate---cysteine ligase
MNSDQTPHPKTAPRVILGVGGGISAYKSAELARALVTRGYVVQPVMTKAATEFITPLTLASLTNKKVITDIFPDQPSPEETLASSIEHISVALENDVLVIAPATADLLAKMAHGLASDFLTTLYLAFPGPVLLAPAMNTNMWLHPAVQANLKILTDRGHHIVGPDAGDLACGMVGAGRMSEPLAIAEALTALLARKHDLSGETFLITAGPTQEPIDPVRFITNRSSGKMGYALAAEAASRGARVILVSGPVHLAVPAGVERVPVKSAAQMKDAVMAHLEQASIILKAAAVADYRPADEAAQKIKKTSTKLSLDLEPTSDILMELGRVKGDRLLIGFAAETQNLAAEARRKLESKNCDMVVGNLVGPDGTGFEGDENEVLLVTPDAEPLLIPKASKREIAAKILDRVLGLRLAAHKAL